MLLSASSSAMSMRFPGRVFLFPCVPVAHELSLEVSGVPGGLEFSLEVSGVPVALEFSLEVSGVPVALEFLLEVSGVPVAYEFSVAVSCVPVALEFSLEVSCVPVALEFLLAVFVSPAASAAPGTVFSCIRVMEIFLSVNSDCLPELLLLYAVPFYSNLEEGKSQGRRVGCVM